MSKRVMRFAGLMLMLTLVSLPKLIEFAGQYARFGISDASAQYRVATWLRALGTFADHPWFGIGFNTYGFVQERRGFERLGTAAYSAEGGLLFIAVLTGIVGLAIYLGMLWFVLRRCRRTYRDRRSSPNERGLVLGAAAATVAVLVNSVFVNSLLTPFVMELLWVLWGLSFVTAASVKQRALVVGQ
jgi:O-antigen ligase